MGNNLPHGLLWLNNQIIKHIYLVSLKPNYPRLITLIKLSEEGWILSSFLYNYLNHFNLMYLNEIRCTSFIIWLRNCINMT